jgi:TolB protein
LRSSIVTIGVVVTLALAACGGGPDDWGGIEADFDTSDAAPDWSPDGRLIAFSSNRDGGGVFVVPTNGQGIRRLTATRGDNPDWSPNGRELVFEAADGVRVISSDGKRERLLVPVRKTDQDVWPTWSPDGKRIAFVREDDGAFVTYVVGRDGGKPRRLLEPALARNDPNWSVLTASELTPAWSPDGKRIAYDSGDGVLVVATIANNKRVTVPTEGLVFEPAWSPDGSEMALQCDGTLCIVDLPTSETRTLLGDSGHPSWSPDGRQVVVERFLYGAGRAEADPQALYIVAASDGEEREPLTFGPGEVDADE